MAVTLICTKFQGVRGLYVRLVLLPTRVHNHKLSLTESKFGYILRHYLDKTGSNNDSCQSKHLELSIIL
jgi:hypothetical protein